jgi:RNA polymerase sigma factor (sigma-70 family)
MTSNQIKIGFIEDNELLLENYREYFESDTAFACVFAVRSFDELDQEKLSEKPDVILLEIPLPGINGIAALPLLKNKFYQTQLIMMTTHDSEENVMNAFKNGANGFLTKNMSLEAVREAVLYAMHSGAALSPSAARILINSFSEKQEQMNAVLVNLTPREQEIAKCIQKGQSYREIAQALFISERTVNQHLKHIYQKTGVKSRSQLAAKMIE